MEFSGLACFWNTRWVKSEPVNRTYSASQYFQSSGGVLEKCCFTGKRLWQNPIGVKLQTSVMQVYYNRTPPWVFSCEFIPGHPIIADSVLSLIKLLCSHGVHWGINPHPKTPPPLSCQPSALKSANCPSSPPPLFRQSPLLYQFFVNSPAISRIFQ